MPEVMIEFREEGPIGINFESRGRDTRGPLTIVGCAPGGAASRDPGVVPNSVVLAVNGASVVGVPFQQAVDMIKGASRPLVLAIRHPAPDPALAQAFEALDST
jgi:C-terminal processing protease CtpA/Prc